jgi:hypothetical protein
MRWRGAGALDVVLDWSRVVVPSSGRGGKLRRSIANIVRHKQPDLSHSMPTIDSVLLIEH